MKKGLWLAVACGTALSFETAAAAGAEATALLPLLPSAITLPARIGPMRYTGAPHKYEDPRLGVSYQYDGNGLSLTVYIYDSGETNLVDGADTMPTCREFEIAKAGVVQTYQKPQLKVEQLVRLNPPDDLPQMREAQYEYELRRKAHDFLHLDYDRGQALREAAPEHGSATARRIAGGAPCGACDDGRGHQTPPCAGRSEVGNRGEFTGSQSGGPGGGSDDALEAGVRYLMRAQCGRGTID